MPLPPELLQACRDTLAALPVDDRGTVSSESLRSVLVGPGGEVPAALWSELFDHLDVDGDGRVSLAELVAGLAARVGPGDRTPTRRFAFDLFDRDGDGRLTRSELRLAARSLGRDPADTGRLLASADIDGDGTLEYVEFLQLIR